MAVTGFLNMVATGSGSWWMVQMAVAPCFLGLKWVSGVVGMIISVVLGAFVMASPVGWCLCLWAGWDTLGGCPWWMAEGI